MEFYFSADKSDTRLQILFYNLAFFTECITDISVVCLLIIEIGLF